jgi:tetratricopeptide (TPR) repeat protein
MITFPLALKRAPSAKNAAAWYVPGDSPAAWIAEMAAWGLPMGGHQLYALPRRSGDKRVGGLLVLPGEGRRPVATPRALGYQLLGGRLLIPLDARLDPPVAPDELERKLSGPLYWLHPSVGLVALRPEDGLHVRDLIDPPARGTRVWNRAQSGITRPPRLVSVEPEIEPSVQNVLSEGREDIGSEAPDEQSREEERERARGGAGGAGGAGEGDEGLAQQAKRKALQALEWMTGKAPETAQSPTWVDRLQEWTRKKLAGLDPGLRIERHKELMRLLRMLKEDPDRGLRYAIPLRGGAGNRGIAEPANRLGAHDTDFNLGRLGGGRPSDSWDAPWEVRQKLLEEYRNAALRALQMGRHRRAAYIYAELLGDFDSAASALRQGKHFREAAVLYRDQLRRPLEAARCLEEGGLLVEAIAIYETLEQHLKVATLYEQLERPEEAVAAYRRAVGAFLAAGDLLQASQVLETRVRAPDEALQLLESGWPGSPQAAACLREHFALLGRLGRHDDAARRTERLRAEGVPSAKLVPLVQTLQQIARTYPDQRVRGSTADLTRVLAGIGLEASEADLTALVHAISALAPEDRLLDRDAHRYLERRRRRGAAAPPPPKPATRDPVEVRRLQLLYPGTYTWKDAVACGAHFYAVGLHRKMRLVVFRGTWDGRMQHVSWPQTLPALPHVVLEPPQSAAAGALVWMHGGTPVTTMTLPANDRLLAPVDAGTPSWLPEATIGVCRDDTDITWVLRREGRTELMLASYSPKGSLIGTVAIESSAAGTRVNLLSREQRPQHPAGAVPMAARQGHVFVGLGSRLLHVFNQAKHRPTELLQDARVIALSAPLTGLVVAVTYASGCSVFWPSAQGDRAAPQHLADGKSEPLVAFTRGGQLVIVTREEGVVYDGPPGRLAAVGRFAGVGEAPVAILPADKREEFAIMNADGAVRVFRLP